MAGPSTSDRSWPAPRQAADLDKTLDFSVLKDQCVLITGGSSGMGAIMVDLFTEHGAHVTIADIKEEQGQKLAQELTARGRSVNFVNTNVTSWESQIAAFKSAIHFSGRGSLDTVVAAAGIAGSMFNGGDGEAPSLDIDPPEPPMMGAVFEINAKGVYMTAKLASHYFRLPSNSTGLDSPRLRKTIIMIGSLAGYLEINSVDYTASKWAVRGMFRAMRSMVEDAGYRANLIAPWVMDTPMTVDFSRECRAAGVPVGDPRDVAKAALRCAVDDSICGRALAVGAKTVFDLEDDYQGLNSGRIMAAYINEEGGTLLRHLEQRP